MNVSEARTYLGTSGVEFQTRGSRRAFVNWLDHNRNTISRQRCGQLGFYASQLLDVLGADVAQHVVDDPEALVARLRQVDLPSVGLPNTHRSHLNRAARALHCWLNDLDPESTARVMDRKAGPGRPRSTTGTARAADGATRAESAARTPAAHAAAGADRDDDDMTLDPDLIAAEMPESYRFFENTVSSQISLAFHYAETVPDVRAYGQTVLSQLAPTTRRQIALDLAATREIAVDLRAVSQASLTAFCDELILSTLERRGVEIRERPFEAA